VDDAIVESFDILFEDLSIILAVNDGVTIGKIGLFWDQEGIIGTESIVF
jgi:hypothetical protein